jgi:parallel beta-helix repeat protein
MRKMFLINLVMAVFIIFVLSVNPDTPISAVVASDSYFVSQSGSDSSPGTEEQPWKTIQKAAESASPGSTVSIKAGTYYERINIKVSGASAEEPIIFKNYNSDRVIIDGSRSSASEQEDMIHISNRSFVELIGLEIVNNTNKDVDYFVTGIGIWGKGEGIKIKNCKIHHIWYTGSSSDSGAQAIAVYGRNDTEPITGLVIDGNEIWDIKCGSSEAVALNGNVDGFEFTNNYVHDNNNIGLALIGDEMLGDDPVCSEEADNRARNGFVGYNKMIKNSCSENPCYPKDDYSAGGIYADGAKDIMIAYNTCSENDIGIEAENETRNKVCSGIIVRDNLIYGNKACGIQAGGYDQNRGWAVDCQFLNNTLYNNDTKNQERGEINIAKSHNLLFRSNIVYTGAQNLAVTTENFGADYIYNITFNNNIYYGPGGSRGLRFIGTDTGLVGLNMWKYKTKQDGASGIADPKLADAAKGDFRLLQYSPAIDFGDPYYIPGEEEKDFGGGPRANGKAVDCGAYEF